MVVPWTRPGGSATSVALVGCGAVARTYYGPALAALEAEGLLVVRGLLDPDPVARREVEVQLPGATVLAALDEVAERGCELAIVATPPARHAEQAIALLERGVGVLCEKPLALRVADAEAMVAAAARTGALLAAGHVRRFFASTRLVGDLLAQGVLGEARTCRIQEGGPFAWDVRSPAHFREPGAGVFADVGVHVLDLLLGWFGTPDSVEHHDDAMGGVDANSLTRLALPGGVHAEVRLSRDCPLPGRGRIECREGWVGWSANDPDEVQLGFAGSTHVLRATLHDAAGTDERSGLGVRASGFHGAFLAQLRDVVTARRDGRAPHVRGEVGLDTVRLLDRCARSRTLVDQGWLGPAERTTAEALASPA